MTAAPTIPATTSPAASPDPTTTLLLHLATLLRPRPVLPLSTWAEQNIVLSSEYSKAAARLRLYGWQRGIFDSFTEERTNDITICCGVQLTKSLFIQAATAYVACEDPGPMLIIQPNDDAARSFSKERLGPMTRDCEALRQVLPATEKGGNTIMFKEFPGGSLALAGAMVPGNLARRTIRYAFFDEVDKYPASAGKEGDPLTLGRERTAKFGVKAKRIYTCSPTIAGGSRIVKSYQSSDRRKPWVPCWSCGTMQVLKWPQVKWDNNHELTEEERSRTAYYQCSNLQCKAQWNDDQRWRSCESTEWRAERPFTGHAGFWISHLYHPDKSLAQVVFDFLMAKDDRMQLQAFINTNLAEAWEEEGSTPDAQVLYDRREDYPFGEHAVVPMRGLFLTAAVDVQENPPRLEVEVKAWGRNRESWSLDYQVIQLQASDGSLLPASNRRLWDELDAKVLQRAYLHATGHSLPIMCMMIDTGSLPKPVYEFALRKDRVTHSPKGIRLTTIRTVVPIKGTDEKLKIIAGISNEDAARKRQNIYIVAVGTHCVKAEVFGDLVHTKPLPDGSPTPGCHHHPRYDMRYFEGLASETKIRDEDGDVEYKKKPNVRNEPLDLTVYNRAAASLVGIDRFRPEHWDQMEKQLGIDSSVVAAAEVLGPSEVEVEVPVFPEAVAAMRIMAPPEQPPQPPQPIRQPVNQPAYPPPSSRPPPRGRF